MRPYMAAPLGHGWQERRMSMARKTVDVETTAQAYLELLRERGIDYFFANAGTDFAPLIDGFARFAEQGNRRRNRSLCRTRTPQLRWRTGTIWSRANRKWLWCTSTWAL